MTEAEEKELLDKLKEIDAGMKAFENKIHEGFNRLEERLDSINEIAEGMLKK